MVIVFNSSRLIIKVKKTKPKKTPKQKIGHLLRLKIRRSRLVQFI